MQFYFLPKQPLVFCDIVILHSPKSATYIIYVIILKVYEYQKYQNMIHVPTKDGG